MRKAIFLPLLFLSSCSDDEPKKQVDFILRTSSEKTISLEAPKRKQNKRYPWQKECVGPCHFITKEYFRCKGNSVNPPLVIHKEGKDDVSYTDCGGFEKHSLPIRNDKEFIYPILLELVNYIQEVTKKQVVITSGHRCPTHNTYLDPSPQNSAAKYMLGAACDLYVQGMEGRPEEVVKVIQNFYTRESRYHGQKEYQEFKRFEKSTTVTKPWFNKEIFIKIFKHDEGRNADNRHGFPYLNLQVRFDRDRNLRVDFTSKDAEHYLRK